jgi:heptosyltransferase-2
MESSSASRSRSDTPVLRFEDIRFDCTLYNGYKPCRHGNECAGCIHYEPIDGGGPDAGKPVTAAREATAPGDGVTRILIIKTGAMGDVLRTTTLLAPLKRAFPRSRVTWITDRSAVPLLKANPGIDELLEMSDDSSRRVEEREFDLLLNFEKEKQPLALSGRVPARRRLGFAPTRWNTPTVFNPGSRYALLLGLSDELKFRMNRKTYPEIIAEMACVEYRRDHYELGLTPESLARQAEIEKLLDGSTGIRVGLNTGCGSVFRTKQWTSDGWAGLVEFLRERSQVSNLLLGGEAERGLNRDIMARSHGVTDTGCDNSLEQFLGVVNACDVVVSSDSLAMHIAVALGKSVVALFGSTSHTEVDLYDRGEKVVTEFACSPCYLKTCDKAPTCMEALASARVGEAVLRAVEQTRAGR